MPAAYSAPILCSTLSLAALVFLAAASTSSCWVLRLVSASALNAPQLVRSSGIGLALTHLALTKPLKSLQASMFLSSSDTSKDGVAGAAAAVAGGGAEAAGSAGLSCLQADRAVATARDRAISFGAFTSLDSQPARGIGRCRLGTKRAKKRGACAPGREGRGYQITTRCASSRTIASPGLQAKAAA